MRTLLFIVVGIALILFLIVLVASDDVEVIDNSDHSIICCNTDDPCIKPVLYTKCNNCAGCPYENYKKE